MNDMQLQKALEAATNSSSALAELVKFANGIGFDCPDARQAAKLAGEVLLGKGTNEQAVMQAMGAAYEAVLFTAMHKAGRINPPDQAYANRIGDMHGQIVRLIQGFKQEQGRVQGNGTSIFTTGGGNQSNGGLFTQPQQTSQTQGSLFGAKPADGNSNSNLFGTPEKPPFASESQASSLFGEPEKSEPNNTSQTKTATRGDLNRTGNPTMESLIAHETEAKLRSTCVTARQVSDSIAIYKDAVFDEDMVKEFNAHTQEIVIVPSSRTPIHIALVNNLRTFEIGEDGKTDKALEALNEDIIKYTNSVGTLVDSDFSERMVSALIATAIDLHTAFDAYATVARGENDLETLTVTDSTRASTAVTAELYRALSVAIDFASEDRGLMNADGTGYVHFELDFSNFKEEATQLKEFFTSYEGKQASMFELIFCQFARALNWIRVDMESNKVSIGRREVRVELPYPLLDNVDVTPHHKLLEREAMGDNLDLLSDITDFVEKRLPAARMQVIDGLYRLGYVDRAYSTGRPKITSA